MKKTSNIYLFCSLTLIPFFIMGCGSEKVDVVHPSEIHKKYGMVILHNSSEAYCQHNVILSGIYANQDYESIVVAMDKNDVTCADYGKGTDRCESFIVKDEADSFACLIGYDLILTDEG